MLRIPVYTAKVNLSVISFVHCLYAVLGPHDANAATRLDRCEVFSFGANGESSRSLRLNGVAALSNGEPDLAISFFDQAVRINQTDVVSWWGIGTAYEQKGNYEVAIKAMVRAKNRYYVERTLNSIERGELLSVDGDEFARAAIKVGMNVSNAYLFLGKRLIETGEIDEAIQVLQLATMPDTVLDPQVDAHLLLGELIYRNDIDEAEAHFTEAVDLSSNDIQIFFQVVMFYIDENDGEKSWKWVTRMNDVYPKASLTHDLLGWLYWLDGDEGLALAHYETAVNADDGLIKPWTYGRLGNIYMSLGQYDNAVSSFQTALSMIDNTSLPLSTNLVKSYLVKGDCENADLLIRQITQQARQVDLPSVELLRHQVTNACAVIVPE